MSVELDDRLPIGTVIERYEVLAVLGSGATAHVYRVRHRMLGTIHALKLLTVDRPSLRRRIAREARVQANLRHPNLVAVTDVVEHHGVPGLVLEHVNGPSLERFLITCRPTLAQVDLLARGILRGVAHAHQHGAIHRDLKPANVLLEVRRAPGDDQLVPKVADFGLVKLVEDESSGTRTGVAMGTPAYMSPEQFEDARGVDVRTDVWALGALLYELCTGSSPFAGPSAAETLGVVLSGKFTPLRELVPSLPHRMEAAITAALQVERTHRPPDVHHLLSLWCGDVPDDRISAVFHRPPPVWDEPTLQLASPPDLTSDPGTSWSSARSPSTLPLEPAPRRWGVVAAVAAALAVSAPLLAGGLLFAGGALVWTRARSEPAPIPVAAPAPSPPTPEVPPEPQPQPQPAPEPEPVAAPRPTPLAQPVSVPVLAPEPTPEPALPVPLPPPAPVPAPGEATFSAAGVERAYLRSTAGTFPQGPVPPGVYDLVVYFDEAPTTLKTGVRVDPGATVAFTCSVAFKHCR